MPEEIPLPEGGFCSWSPDGKKLAYNRVMREFRTWKYYRGGMADDIWIWDPKAKKVSNITSNDAQDIFPMWIGDKIYFASDRDMTMNLFCYETKSGKTTKVTDFKDYDIKFPSSDGKTIVFENGGWIWRFNPADGSCAKVPVTLAGDNIQARPERRAVGKRITGSALSPDGTRMVATARGEVFDIPVGKGVTRNISRSPGSNDRSADWSPDGKYIAWIGDSTGETDVKTLQSTIADNEARIASSLQTAYLNVIAAKNSYLYLQSAAALAEQTAAQTAQRYALGTASRLDYETAQVGAEQAQLAFRPAEYALLQTMKNYEWAVKGLAAASAG